MQENLASFLEALRKFNTLKSDATPTPDNVKAVMKTMLQDDDEFDNFFDDLFQLGGAMYLMGCHYAVVKNPFSNPQWVAEKTVGTSSDVKEFKDSPTIKGLKWYLSNTCTAQEPRSPRKGNAKRNLAELLDSDEEDTPPPATSTSAKKGEENTQKLKNLIDCLHLFH